MRRRIWLRIVLGFLLGIVVGNLIAFLSSGGTFPWVSKEFIIRIGSPMAAFWIQCLLFGLYGCLAVGGMSVYEIEEWSLLRVSVMHYLMIVIGYLVMSWILCFGNGVFDNLIVIGIMSGVYFVIWLINWMSYRKRIRRLNEMLEERKRREEIKETESGENNIEKISRRIKK